MRKLRILIASLLGFILGMVLFYRCKGPLPIAPDVHMLTECDSFVTILHVFNSDVKTIRYSAKVYVDSNDNQSLDSSDIFLYSEPLTAVRPLEEHIGLPIRSLPKYKKYSFIAQITTEDMIVYYESIPCDQEK